MALPSLFKKDVKKYFKKRWLFFLLVFLFSTFGSLLTFKPNKVSCGFVLNSSGHRVHLKASKPLILYFDPQFPREFQGEVLIAAETWNKAVGRTVFDVRFTPVAPSQPGEDGKSIIYWLKSWNPSIGSQQANTTIYWDGDIIREADIKFNATGYRFSNVPSKNTVDIQSLALHEMGHILGFTHNDSDPSIMATFLSSGFERRNLYAADLNHLRCEY